MKKLLLFLGMMISLGSLAQINLDSLHEVYSDQTISDSLRFEAFDELIWKGYMNSNPDTAFELAKRLAKEAEELNFRFGKIQSLRLQGVSLAKRGLFAQAEETLLEGLEKSEQLSHETEAALANNNLGVIFKMQSKHAEAIQYYTRCYEIRKAQNDSLELIPVLTNLGDLCIAMGNMELAQEYLNEAQAIAKNSENKLEYAAVLYNLGRLSTQQQDTLVGLDYYANALQIRKSLNDYSGVQGISNSMARIYEGQGKMKEALRLYQEGLDLAVHLDDKNGMASAYNYLGGHFNRAEDYNQAKSYYSKAYELSTDINAQSQLRSAAYGLYYVAYMEENWSDALGYYQAYIEVQDKLNSKQAKKGLMKLELVHEYEKDQIVKAQEEEEAARIEAEKIATRNSLQYSGIGLGIFALFGLLFMIGRIRLPQWGVELSVFLPFLIFFEFLLVITDPYVDAISGGEPIIKLLLNAMLAGLIFPLHSFFERLLKRKLFKGD